MEINHEVISLNETTIGPYTEREILNASCSLSHSYHYPMWYNWTLDGDWLPLVATNTSTLHLGPLNRTHFMKNLCCIASSVLSLRPTSICAQLLVNLGAESVSIRAWHSPLVLGIPQEIECEVHGGFPPPEITWRLNDEPYLNIIFYDSTQLWAVSVIVLTPEEKHMGARLECRAENRNAGEYKSQFIRLDIKYKPDVTLKIGQGLNATGINAGSDVYLECSVQEILLEQTGQTKANHVITWKHNGKVLKLNRTAGILITDKYLVLRNVQKRHRGHYTCQVMNTAFQEGEDVISSPLFLVIHYAPRCTTNAVQKAFVDKGSKATLLCPVDMQPWNRFSRVYWSILMEDNFTRSNNLEIDITEHMLEVGVVTCWGENKLGSGRQSPCRLQLLEQDSSSGDLHSSGVHQEMIRAMECTVHNVTTRAILVGCENFNNNFANYTVVAELLRNHQVINNAQLSFNRAWHWMNSLLPSTEYVIDFRVIRNAKYVKAKLEKLSNLSGTLSDETNNVRTLALQIAPYLKSSGFDDEAFLSEGNVFKVHTRTLDKDFQPVEGDSSTLFNMETVRVAMYTAICLLSMCATAAVCYLGANTRKGGSGTRQVHIPKDPTPLQFTTSSL
ncbi:sidestep protein-like [Tropilaelaps mercedesae]|uniref:Sidestep protein-like n=1 Tax=Tropilaelaps mercedesae TaxID=418985 RepID=A0A1V9XZE9_9ACAR|nr:sidestep protein-like [Tropilaelaps mercedesae]